MIFIGKNCRSLPKFDGAFMTNQMPGRIFEETIEWLRTNYPTFNFFVERDIVWTIQRRLTEAINVKNLPYRVFHDYPILQGKKRAICDLVILDKAGKVMLAAEFKYEPSHKREDIWHTKFPVVFWGKEGVAKDIERIQNYVVKCLAEVGYFVFIDEGSSFRHRAPHEGSHWIDWGSYNQPHLNVSVLWFKLKSQIQTDLKL